MVSPRPRRARRGKTLLLSGVLVTVGSYGLATRIVAQQPTNARLDSVFLTYTSPGSPGCAVAATRAGVRLEGAYGLADLEHSVPITMATIFEAGSVSKQFTAAAVVLLAQRGRLSLDDDIRKYLPEVPDFGGRHITIRQMLNHASGLRDWGVIAEMEGWPRGSRVYTNADALDMVTRQRGLNFDPGAEWMYSNTNFVLAAVLVQRVSGVSLAEFTRRELFAPLSMTHTSWRDDHNRIVEGRAVAYDRVKDTLKTAMPTEDVYGAGGLLTTVGDLLLWNEELSTGKVLGRALGEELEREGVLNGGKRDGYGLGLFLGSWRGEREIAHTGATGGYRAVLSRMPEKGISLALLCNVGTANTSTLGHEVADILLGDVATKAAGQPPRAPSTPSANLRLLAAAEGLYRDPGSMTPVQVEADGGRLKVRGMVLHAVSATEFQRTVGETTVRVLLQPVPQGSPRVRIIARNDTTLLERVPPADTSRLSDYAGDWYSPEAEATWSLMVADGKLVAGMRPDVRFPLTPAYRDAFASSEGSVWVFERDGSGNVAGLKVWAPRARAMPFERQIAR